MTLFVTERKDNPVMVFVFFIHFDLLLVIINEKVAFHPNKGNSGQYNTDKPCMLLLFTNKLQIKTCTFASHVAAKECFTHKRHACSLEKTTNDVKIS